MQMYRTVKSTDKASGTISMDFLLLLEGFNSPPNYYLIFVRLEVLQGWKYPVLQGTALITFKKEEEENTIENKK